MPIAPRPGKTNLGSRANTMPSSSSQVVAREHRQLVELEPDAVADEAHLRRAVAHEMGFEPVVATAASASS